MAVDMFLKLEGIKGEAQDKVYGKDGIDVLAWSWGMSQSGTTHMGSGGGAGKANFNDLSITKWVDSASALLMEHLTTGKHIEKGKIVVRKAGDKPLEYIIIHMNDIMVTSVSTGGSGGEDRLTENLTLNFSKFWYEYVPQKEDGSGDAVKETKYDIAENSKDAKVTKG
jgi:type VI secretion system secreted protein Hcp